MSENTECYTCLETKGNFFTYTCKNCKFVILFCHYCYYLPWRYRIYSRMVCSIKCMYECVYKNISKSKTNISCYNIIYLTQEEILNDSFKQCATKLIATYLPKELVNITIDYIYTEC